MEGTHLNDMRTLLLLLAFILLASCSSVRTEVQGVLVHYVGQFDVDQNNTDKGVSMAPWRPSGYGSSSPVESTTYIAVGETNAIAPTINSTFGIYYSVVGVPAGRPVRIKEIIRYPSPGKLNEDRRFRVEEIEVRGETGRGKLLAFSFGDEKDVLPGIWTVEIWHKDRMLARQLFEVAETRLESRATTKPSTSCDRFSGSGRSERRVRVCLPERVWREIGVNQR